MGNKGISIEGIEVQGYKGTKGTKGYKDTIR